MLPPLHRLSVAPTTPVGAILDSPSLPNDLLREIERQLVLGAADGPKEACRTVRNWLAQQGYPLPGRADLPRPVYQQLCERLDADDASDGIGAGPASSD